MSGSATLATDRFRLATAATRMSESEDEPRLLGTGPGVRGCGRGRWCGGRGRAGHEVSWAAERRSLRTIQRSATVGATLGHRRWRPPSRPRHAHDPSRPHGGAVARLGVMDLHVIGPLASPAERAAVDAVLGPPESGWVGGPRDSAIDGHAARGGHATRVPPLAAAAGPPRGPVADRLDQHAGPQLRLQAAGRRAGRGVRRGDVLRPLRDEAAAAGRGPRLRRHRLPAGRRGRAVRGPDPRPRTGRRTDP